jgi:formylglycine-generating enzyme required for sulfatase activity
VERFTELFNTVHTALSEKRFGDAVSGKQCLEHIAEHGEARPELTSRKPRVLGDLAESLIRLEERARAPEPLAELEQIIGTEAAEAAEANARFQELKRRADPGPSAESARQAAQATTKASRIATLIDIVMSRAEDRSTRDAALRLLDRALELAPENAETRELREQIQLLYTGAMYHPGETREVELDDLNIVIETAWVPAGVFTMGSPATEAKRYRDEGPQHEVRISRGFWMMTTEVQQGQFEAVMGYNPSEFRDGASSPVERVSWYEAVEFANKLTESVARKNPRMNLQPYYIIDVRERDDEGRIEQAEVRIRAGARGYRLPTEAEWEYACRAGTTGPFHFWTTISTDLANYNGTRVHGSGVEGEYRLGTTPAGFFNAPNAFGVQDMHGNLWEWCWDRYDADFHDDGKWPTNVQGERVDPTGPQTGSERALRGGSWFDPAWYLRSANRGRLPPSRRGKFSGFRLTMDSSEQPSH